MHADICIHEVNTHTYMLELVYIRMLTDECTEICMHTYMNYMHADIYIHAVNTHTYIYTFTHTYART